MQFVRKLSVFRPMQYGHWIRSASQSVYKPKTLDRPNPVSLVKGYLPGQKLYGFTVTQVQEIPELCLTAMRLAHDQTGADYLHLARDDRNNVFSVGFRTTPMDSTGVPHILEHTVLCGSEKYPCRDPFFKMLSRSLATYMNALTGSDFTLYPFATQNAKDYENLMRIYLDAVFAPCLRELDFWQEGWRLEHEDVNDASSPIVFKGVVFNEMKGAFANSDQLFAQHVQKCLLPSHTYGHVSGGDPLSIPDLTWEQLRKFHATHYHPSNARFYSYGDFPLENHLQLVDELVLRKFSRLETDTKVPNEKRWQSPHSATLNCRPDPLLPNPEKSTTVSVSYLLGDIADTFEASTLQILSALLVSGSNSPFYQALLEPNIGSSYAPVTGYDGNTKESSFSIGLQGVHSDDVPKVTKLIDETFDKVIRSGFEPERIEAILHSIELALKHQTSNFGLHVALSIMPIWTHDGDPIRSLLINAQVEHFQRHLRDNPTFLQDKIRHYFKNNQHQLTVTMTPNPSYEQEVAAKEEEKLGQKISALTSTDQKILYDKGLQLVAKQNEKENVSCLPTLRISDIEPHIQFMDIEEVQVGGVPLQIVTQPTNGVTYFQAVLNTRHLPDDLKSYLPLFCNVITRLGAGNMNYKQLSQKIELKTGGLSVGIHVSDHHSLPDVFEEGIHLQSHCLDRNINDMLSLWTEIFNRVTLNDQERLSTLIRMMTAELVSSLPDVGHSYAMKEASNGLSSSASLRERLTGMRLVKQMRNIAELKDLTPITSALQEIAKHVLSQDFCRLSINSTPETISLATKEVEKLVTNLPTGCQQSLLDENCTSLAKAEKCHYVLPFPINFVSKCIPTVLYTHQDFASLRILARLMSSKFLLREIREKGGAYGGGASLDAAGIFCFYSYRDPHNLETLKCFDHCVHWSMSNKFTDQDIDESKLAIFQQVDKPIAPGDRGSRYFLSRLSDPMFQEHRKQLFAVNQDTILQAANKYLLNPSQFGACILGPETKATMDDPSWKLVTEYRDMQ